MHRHNRNLRSLAVKKIIIAIGLLLIFSNIALGEVLFQDNFDDQEDWTRIQQTAGDDVCYSNCDAPTGWTSWRNGFSYCPGGPGNNNMYLQAENARNNSGKAMTFWDESCTNMFEDSDGMIAKLFDVDHTEIYIRFYLKFQPNYEWMTYEDALAASHPDTAQHKFWHVQHYCRDGGTPYAYFGARDRCNYPLGVGGFYVWVYSGGASFYLYNAFGCEETDCAAGTPGFTSTLGDTDNIELGSLAEMQQPGNLLDGNWHSIEQRYKMNTNDGATFNADGIFQVWIDGELIHSRTDVPYSNNASEQSPRRGWNFIALGGNNNNRWTNNCSGAGCEQWYTIDDVVIATEYIGHIGVPKRPENLRVVE